MILRRDVVSNSFDCQQKVFDLSMSIDLPDLPDELSEYQQFTLDEFERMRADVREHHMSGLESWSENLMSIKHSASRDVVELQRELTSALFCIELMEKYSERNIQLVEEMTQWERSSSPELENEPTPPTSLEDKNDG